MRDWGLPGHRDAVEIFLDRADAVPAARWAEPRAPGKWSPAELTEHLSLTYDGVLQELLGGVGVRVRVKGFRRLMIRWLVMPRFLNHGFVPAGVRAPREVVPAGVSPDKAAGLDRFRGRARDFEQAIAPLLHDRQRRVTHPFFGPLTMAQGLRFVEVHLRHHTKQLPST